MAAWVRVNRPNPRLARAMDIMFTLHAEHEMNCSTAAARHLASSGVDVYTAIAGGAEGSYLQVKVCSRLPETMVGHMHEAKPSRHACFSRTCVPIGWQGLLHAILHRMQVQRQCRVRSAHD